jgi:hypothetical protein
MSPFPQEHELIGLFESEPRLADAKVPWAYNHLWFSRTIGDNLIECEIEPGYETVKLRWTRNGAEIINLGLHWVAGIRVETRPGMEALVVEFRNINNLLPLRLQLRPTIHVAWGTSLY